MIDFVKVVITNSINEWSSFYNLLQNKKHNANTLCDKNGVLIKEVFQMDHSLKFIIRYNEDNTTKRVEMQVSLHKYFAQGYNYNDFTFNHLCRTIISISNTYGINPSKAIIQNLEVGANIALEDTTQSFLEGLYFYNLTPFHTMKNSYRTPIGLEATLADYVVKAYDKRRQLLSHIDIGKEVLRYELHFNRMRKVNKCGIYALDDLLEYENISALALLLIESLEGLIHYDSNYLNACKNKLEEDLLNYWSNPKKVVQMAKEQPQKYRRQRRLFKQLSQRNNANVISHVQTSLKRKVNNLICLDKSTIKQLEYYKSVYLT